jgi:catechol 2,3-dioxygenase-like lactoylglutathione lyase family enzyme
MTLRIHLTSVYVEDQDRALRFYTDVLGFEPRQDMPLGNGDRWLTRPRVITAPPLAADQSYRQGAKGHAEVALGLVH